MASCSPTSSRTSFLLLQAAALKLAPGTARKQKLKVTLASREKGLQGQGRCRRACHSTDGC